MRRLAWIRMSLIAGIVALGVPACGDDEASFVDAGGSGGTRSDSTGGTNSGSGGTGGGSAGGGAMSGTQLGIECEGDADCPTGLICLTSGSSALSEGGPAHGFCSFPCGDDGASAADADAECQRYDANSLCHFFDADTAYCVQRCTFGMTASRASKCQGRDDVVCDLVLHPTPSLTECTSDEDCDIGDRCFLVEEGSETGICFDLPQVCLPRCNSDRDCPVGRFCDPGSGECVDDEPTGKPFNEPCDPDAEVDECAGFCSSADGVCLEFCVLGTYPACRSTSNTEGTAACLFVLSESASSGDVGICGQLCDCSDECPASFSCVQFADSDGTFEVSGRPGYCGQADRDTPVLTDCGAGGTGGTGGTTGSAGEAGQGGSP